MHRHRNAGFSLIEALLALGLVASVSAAFVPALAGAARLQRESDIATRAVLIAGEAIAELRAAAQRGELEAGEGTRDKADGYECRWRASPIQGLARAWLVVAEVRFPGHRRSVIRVAAVVSDA